MEFVGLVFPVVGGKRGREAPPYLPPLPWAYREAQKGRGFLRLEITDNKSF